MISSLQTSAHGYASIDLTWDLSRSQDCLTEKVRETKREREGDKEREIEKEADRNKKTGGETH